MNIRNTIRTSIILTAALAALPGLGAERAAAGSLAVHDGRHDFDFNIGTWKTRIRILSHPLSGSTRWSRFDGTVVVRPLWGGKGQLEQIEAQGSHGHFEGMTLFLYDTRARQWGQYFANSESGALDSGVRGSFKGRQGEFYGEDSVNGRAVLVRMVWTVTSATEHHVVQSFSADGGRTWEANFIGDLTAARETPSVPPVSSDPAQHDFDWQFGDWKIHMQRLLHPLSNAETWTTYDGSVEVMKLWAGRANLAEIAASGPSGSLQFLALRLFNPRSQQWALYFAHAGSDAVEAPMYGGFKEGHGTFYDEESLDGRSILGRFAFDSTDADSGRDEQAFSADGGRTWEVNWVNHLRRATK
ncbi:MAG TPA: hypothetical protein VHE11_11025 [Steroidobacteraceae bacterium]|nr:hypothetical protein [Steroidobacteraceae bacterium]